MCAARWKSSRPPSRLPLRLPAFAVLLYLGTHSRVSRRPPSTANPPRRSPPLPPPSVSLERSLSPSRRPRRCYRSASTHSARPSDEPAPANPWWRSRGEESSVAQPVTVATERHVGQYI